MRNFPNYRQLDKMDCGPSCLRIIGKHFGRNFNLQSLREACGINREGVSLYGISEAAEKIGFRTSGVKLTIDQIQEVKLPIIIHWRQNHFVVLYRIKNDRFYISDPASGLVMCNKEEFKKAWISVKGNDILQGIALLISPTPKFYDREEENVNKVSFSYLTRYLHQYRNLVIQLFIALGVGSILQLIFPFLTQSIVDIGINTRNLGFIYIILIAQIMLFLGRLSVNFIRSWILLHISARVSISILTDFLIKLMRLPMKFFDTKMTGDIMQRMGDQKRIESFLTGQTLTTIFSLFNLVIFGFILAYYNTLVFVVFLFSSVAYFFWIILFLKKRRILDFRRFSISSRNQSSIVQLISGMQEIKLNNSEQQRRWEWERIQAGLFRFQVKSLSLSQYQQAGAFFINEGKNIVITFLVAKSVVEGDLTLGAMMAVQYIIGQLNGPIEQLISFMQQFQDAKISLERLNEIHEQNDEEPIGKTFIRELPKEKSIYLRNIQFTYPGAGNNPILKKLSLTIPEGKTTAIVGMSGSGKTTLLKLLLRFYTPEVGEIKIGENSLEQISHKFWRSKCGTVMQDGFIFSDSITRNIAVGDEYPDFERLRYSMETSRIFEFVESLPLGLDTMIGAEGNGISQGQRQRILIARAVYKDPEYLFFDEATNALDAENEKLIIENLETFFKGRTVVVVAHRLSTVKHADNIVVLDNGELKEQGTHVELIALKGKYYELVRNQLELSL